MVKASGAKLDFDDVSLSPGDDSGEPHDGSIDHISVRAVFPRKKLSKRKARDSAVKINSELLMAVEEFINLDENKFRYVNRKQFIDLAVSEFLRKEKKVMKNG